MVPESQIPIASQQSAGRFARPVALFYGALFGLLGSHLPFFPVWLRAVGIDAAWIGVITAVPAVTRFTVLPFVTGLAEQRHAVRGALILATFATAAGFAAIGSQHHALPVFLIYVATCCLWTPTVPLTDAYALRGIVRYGLNYGRLRLWGSAAFVAGALAVRTARRRDCRSTPHLGYHRPCRARRSLEPCAAAARQSADRRAHRSWRRCPASPDPLPRHHRLGGTDPGQPRRLLYVRLHHLAASGIWRTDHCRLVGAGRAGGDRGIRTLAALYDAPGDAGRDRGARSGHAMDRDRAGTAGRTARGRAARARLDLWAYPSRHHGPAGAACARACHGARSRLSRRSGWHRLLERVNHLGRDLCALRAGCLLRDGADGRAGRHIDVAGATPPGR